MNRYRLSVYSRACLWLFALLAGCGSGIVHAQPRPSLAPLQWDAGIKLSEAIDRNPDPRIVEIELVARLSNVEIEGVRVQAWTYNDGIPGPLIRARVSDRLIVHFKNELPQSTTVHWHGVRVPIEMDGVPGISQPEARRGEDFTYDFELRDAGLYWYHPHVMSAAQVGFGLYGALLVEDPAEPIGVVDEITLVLSDIGFDQHGVLERSDSGGAAGMVFGREGAVVLVNGKRLPRLLARSGALQRWRIVNAAKSRFFSLELDGQPMTVIGGDGGFFERPVTTDNLLITPGERFDVLVWPHGKPGSTLVLQSMLYNRGYGSVEFRNVEELLTIEFSREPPLPAAKAPVVARTLTPPAMRGSTSVELTFTLPPMNAKGESEFQVNGRPFWRATPITARLGETQLWTLKNDTQWDHPFHLHGFFFMVLDDQGSPVRPLAWKDTVNVPKAASVRFLVTFDERPGTWMFHCHILDHADGGLMGTVQVGNAVTSHTHVKTP